jgi:hypothetical protein
VASKKCKSMLGNAAYNLALLAGTSAPGKSEMPAQKTHSVGMTKL